MKPLLTALLPVLIFGQSIYAQNFNMQNGEFTIPCSSWFFDSGGKDADYTANEDHTITFFSEKGQRLIVEFTEFNTVPDKDKLYIYDGLANEQEPVAVLTGNNLRNTLSSNIVSSGDCITFRFISGDHTPKSGWSALISYFEDHQAEENYRNLVVDYNTPYDDVNYLVEEVLVTGCLEAFNITYTGHYSAIGYFDGTACPVLGIENGVIIATEDIYEAPGPNDQEGALTDIPLGTAGDSDLETLYPNIATYGTFDAGVLEFDFVPQSDMLSFNYAFASEEYPEFVCSKFNDVFAFFLTGPNPAGGNYTNTNIALIPGTTVPVAINTINNGSEGTTTLTDINVTYCEEVDINWNTHTMYYIDNGEGFTPSSNPDLQYDGLTVPLAAEAEVVACETYHLKIAIADVGDGRWDSAVFLEANSFSSGEGVEMEFGTVDGGSDVYEGCDIILTFIRADTTDLSAPYDVQFTVSGTATGGTDYDAIPATVTIPAGQVSVTFSIATYADGLPEGTESIIITLQSAIICPCDPPEEYTVTVNIMDSPLTIDLTDVDICPGESASLTTNITVISINPYTYDWSTGDTYTGDDLSHSITVTPPAGTPPFTTTYYVTVTDGCGNTVTDEVNVNTLVCDCETPPVPFTIDQPPCCGDDATITYTGPGLGTESGIDLIDPDYTWDIGSCTLVSGTQNGSGVPGILVVTPPDCAASYDIQLTVTNHEGTITCSSSQHTETITVPSLVTISVTGTHPSCFGVCDATASASGSGGTGTHTYLWDNNAGTNADAINLCGGTTYNVTVSDINGCTATGSHTPVDPPLLTLTVTGTNPSCYGLCDATATSQTQGGTGGYSYLWDNNAGTASDATDLCGGITYTLTVTDENYCTATASHTPVDPPAIVIDNPVVTDVTCFGYGDGTITVSASGGTPPLSYSIPGDSNTNGVFTGLAAEQYIITVTDANGCTNTIPATITEPPQLVLTITSDTVCIDEITSVTVYPSGGTPDYSYLWSNNQTTQSVTDIPGVTTNYSVVVTDANNCVETISTTVFVYPPLAIQVYPNDTICEGESATIYATYSGGMGAPYTLTLNGSTTIQTPYTVSPSITTVYEVCVNDNCPTPEACDDLEVVVMPDPPVDFVADIYDGCAPLTVHFNEINQHVGQTYFWDFGDPWGSTTGYGKNPDHTFDNPGFYDISCTVTSEFGCTSSWTWYEMIAVWPNPVAAFFPYPQVATILEPLIYFENNSSTYYITNWTFGDGDSSNVVHPQHKYDGPGTYNVMLAVETEHGCVDTTWSEVVIQDIITFYAPTAFSPDFDYMNGLFSPIGHGIDRDHWHLMIYDRWGEKIWETYIYDADEETGEVYHGWDGTIRGRKIGETAVYSWLVIYRDVTGAEHQQSGLVTLIR